jgi:hypothetical protein
MRKHMPDKLLDIAVEIDQRGFANLNRLTVLKKWFEVSSRLLSFAIFIADRASRQMEKATKNEAELFGEARVLLDGVDIFAPNIPRDKAIKLHTRLRAFQNDHRNASWGTVLRIIYNHNLYLVECGLHIYLSHGVSPKEGYRLAVNYCEHYDPRYGNGLSGPSRKRIEDIVDFIRGVEDREKASV